MDWSIKHCDHACLLPLQEHKPGIGHSETSSLCHPFCISHTFRSGTAFSKSRCRKDYTLDSSICRIRPSNCCFCSSEPEPTPTDIGCTWSQSLSSGQIHEVFSWRIDLYFDHFSSYDHFDRSDHFERSLRTDLTYFDCHWSLIRLTCCS